MNKIFLGVDQGNLSSGQTVFYNNGDWESKYIRDEIIIPIDFDWSSVESGITSSISSGKTLVIQHNFDLLDSTIELPTNIIFKFINDGAINNAILTGERITILGDETSIGILEDSSIIGTVNNGSVNPEWFGSEIQDYDWYQALQTSIDIVSVSKGEVKLSSRIYRYIGNLQVPAGITISGVSRGSTVFSAGPTDGSLLHCIGPVDVDNRALEIMGRFVTLRNFALKGESRWASTIDGLVMNGVGDGDITQRAILESLNFENLQIHSFRIGKWLIAGNSGAVTYSRFSNIRIRDCQEHLRIDAFSDDPVYGNLDNDGLAYTNENCFINSNIWSGFYSSGYAKTSISINSEAKQGFTNNQKVYLPANNLIFDGVVIEPPYAENGYIVLKGGGSQIKVHDIRVEALQQDTNFEEQPVIYLGEGVNGCYIGTDQESASMVDLGYNNEFVSRGSKSAIVSPSSDNLFKNSALIGLRELFLEDDIYLVNIPEWTIQEQYVGSGASYSWRPLQVDSNISLENYDGELLKLMYHQNIKLEFIKILIKIQII